MIFKLLVVDDEATMRKGIANFMNWSSIDCQIAGTASDGLEAIDFLQKHDVDIVITDIKMPEADGLEVARFVYENNLNCKVILLTGYADFTYAQTAIRYNVSSFILKPTNKKSLFEAVQEAQKELIESKRNSSIAKEEIAFLKDQLLQELTDQPPTPELRERLVHFHLSLTHYYMAAFQMVPVNEDISVLKKIIISEKKNAYCYRYNNLILVIYFSEKEEMEVPLEILKNCREIIDIADSISSYHAAVGISHQHHGPDEFICAVSEAISALTKNFYSAENIAVFSGLSNGESCDLSAESSMDLFQFENSLNNREFSQAQALLSNIFMKFKSNLVNSQDTKNICSQIYYICSRVLLKNQCPTLSGTFLSGIHDSSDIFSLEKQVMKLMEHTKEQLLGSSRVQNKLVESAVHYICGHLSESLSLESIAEQLHISPSHLSRTFKKICNESLTEYINKMRINEAKKLLANSDILTYEIAELVGYHDATYFSSIFKKYTSVSPTDYRQKLRSPF